MFTYINHPAIEISLLNAIYINFADAINYILKIFKFEVQNPGCWHQNAKTCRSCERPYFLNVCNLCIHLIS